MHGPMEEDLSPNVTGLFLCNHCDAQLATPLNEAAISNYTRIGPVTDSNATLEFRVRSYLDAALIATDLAACRHSLTRASTRL